MTTLMNGLLERVLSEELGRQTAWRQQDTDRGFDTADREKVMQEIRDFMKENDIKYRDDFFTDGYCREVSR